MKKKKKIWPVLSQRQSRKLRDLNTQHSLFQKFPSPLLGMSLFKCLFNKHPHPPAPFNGSSAQAQIVLLEYDRLYDYWVSDFVIDTPGGTGPFGNWNDDYDVDIDLRNYGPFRVVEDDILHGAVTDLNGKLIPHQIGPR